MRKTTPMYLILTLLATLPALAALAGAAPGGDDQEATVKTVERVVVAPVDGEVHVLADDEGAPPMDDDATVRVVVVGRDGDGEEGDAKVHRYAWRTEDGQMVELEGEPGNVFFAPGAERGFLGVQLTDLTPELRRHFGANEDQGVLVAKVVEDSPAARAGLKVGDVLTHIDGEAVTSSFDVTTRIGAREDGEVVGLEVVRDGRVDNLSATLETRERPQIEVGHVLRHLPRGEGGSFAFEFDPESFEQQMEEMRQYFGSPEWKTKIEGMNEDLRKRLEELDVEIEGLEDQIDVQVEVHKDDDDAGEADGGGN